MKKPIVLPTPKFQFGDILCIRQWNTVDEHEVCPECFDGKLKVFGPKGDMKEVTCKKCSGSGKLYKIVSRKGRLEIVGMLEITRYQVEISNPPNTWSGFDGEHYAGKMVWKEDLEKDDRQGNVFREKHLVRPEDCEPLGEFKELKRDDRGTYVYD